MKKNTNALGKFFLILLNCLLDLMKEFVVLSICMSVAGLVFYFIIREIPYINWKNFMLVLVISISIGFFLFSLAMKKIFGEDVLG